MRSNHAEEFGIFKTDVGARYVEAKLFPCEVPDACEAIFYQYSEGVSGNSTEFTVTEPPFLEGFEEGMWRLDVEGNGVDLSAVPGVGWQDSWSLWVTVLRPCVEFPENDDDCIPTVDI